MPLPESVMGSVVVRGDHYQAEYLLRGQPGNLRQWVVDATPINWDHIEGPADVNELTELAAAVIKAHSPVCDLIPIDPRTLPPENV